MALGARARCFCSRENVKTHDLNAVNDTRSPSPASPAASLDENRGMKKYLLFPLNAARRKRSTNGRHVLVFCESSQFSQRLITTPMDSIWSKSNPFSFIPPPKWWLDGVLGGWYAHKQVVRRMNLNRMIIVNTYSFPRVSMPSSATLADVSATSIGPMWINSPPGN